MGKFLLPLCYLFFLVILAFWASLIRKRKQSFKIFFRNLYLLFLLQRYHRDRLEPLGKQIDHINKVGQGLIQSAALGVDTSILEQDLDALNEQWNSLKQRVSLFIDWGFCLKIYCMLTGWCSLFQFYRCYSYSILNNDLFSLSLIVTVKVKLCSQSAKCFIFLQTNVKMFPRDINKSN